jgi:hypothetical protein
MLLAAAAVASTWEVDIERPARFPEGAARRTANGARLTVRESRISIDPARRSGVALLSVRHRSHDETAAPPAPRAPFPIRAWLEEELRAAVAAAGLTVVDDLGGATRFRWLLRPHATLAR